MMEIWKIFNDVWEVSTEGRVRVLGGEPIDNLCVRGGYKVFYPYGFNRPQSVHRAVMMTFRPSPSRMLNFVDHINRTRTDNRLENLRWSNATLNRMNTGRHKWSQETDGLFVPCKTFLGRRYRFPAEKSAAAAQGVAERFHDRAFAVTEVLSTIGLPMDLQRMFAEFWAPMPVPKNTLRRKTP